MDVVTTPALVGRAITVRLGGSAVVSNVDISVDHGEWVTIIGPNGAGKSTLLRALAGLQHVTSGDIDLDGTPLSGIRRRVLARSIALVAQKPAVPPGCSVTDYVLLGRTPYVAPLRREGGRDLAIVHEVLDRLDLLGFADRTLTTMSGGELQRAFIARALAQQAPLLMLDEPTSALDVGHQQDVLELVDSLRRDSGLTVVTTMHDLSLAAQYSERMLLLNEGRLVATGTPAEVLTTERVATTYGASVEVIPGNNGGGPTVVPVRRTAERT